MDPYPPLKDKKGPAPGALVCGNCLAPEGSEYTLKLSACSRCGLVAYCSKDCQRIHWKANHRKFCVAKADRAPSPQAAPDAFETPREAIPQAPEANILPLGDACAICLDPLTAESSAYTLPCAHVFHAACVAELRLFGVNQLCPICRTKLPPGPEQLHEDAVRRYVFLKQRRVRCVRGKTPSRDQVNRTEASWGTLTRPEKQDMHKVLELWREASGQGYAASQYSLGLMYTFGTSVKLDYAEAFKLYRKAADQGHTMAEYNLGVCFAEGKGVKKDIVESLTWARKAAVKGLDMAQNQLGTAYAKGLGLKQDHSEAFNWVRKAADQGLETAQFNLGLCYESALGVERDLSKAFDLFTLAANQGSEKAKKQLDGMQSTTSLIGAVVELQGLKAKPELNGTIGVVKYFFSAKNRYEVLLVNGAKTAMLLKKENLKQFY